jgi:hypothetical protein
MSVNMDLSKMLLPFYNISIKVYTWIYWNSSIYVIIRTRWYLNYTLKTATLCLTLFTASSCNTSLHDALLIYFEPPVIPPRLQYGASYQSYIWSVLPNQILAAPSIQYVHTAVSYLHVILLSSICNYIYVRYFHITVQNTSNSITLWYLHYMDQFCTSTANFMLCAILRTSILMFHNIIRLCFVYAYLI